MGKPKLFVALRNGHDLQNMSNKLDKKFEVHYWSHNRWPTREEMKANVKGVFGIICSIKPIIDSEILDAAGKNLRGIVTLSTGYDHLDVKTIKAKGVRIGCRGSPPEMTVAVAEYAVGLLLATARHIANDYLALRKNVDSWNRGLFFYHQHHTLRDSVVGIIGCGNIGFGIAKRLLAFSPKKILYSSRKQKPEADAIGGEWRSIDDVCKTSDFIIITIQLNEETHHLFDRARLNSLKPNAILVNIARGGIIDEKALVDVLRNKRIAGAGLDVFDEEPIQPNNPLLNLDNVVVTPHAAWNSPTVWSKTLDIAAENMLAIYENREMPSEVL